MTSLKLSAENPVTAKVDALVVGVLAQGSGTRAVPVVAPGAERIDAAFGDLAALLTDLGMTGRAGAARRVPGGKAVKAPVVVAVGIGKELTPETLRAAAASATHALRGAGTVTFALPADTPELLAAQAEGALLGGYDFVAFRHSTRTGRQRAVKTVLVTVDDAKDKAAAAALKRSRIVAEAIGLARDLVNTPPRDLSPAVLAEHAVQAGDKNGARVEVTDEKALLALGFGGLSGVGQGSARPPRLVAMRWAPAGATHQVALVGKGITFDSGGLSLKPPASMETMKDDMAGAAAVLAVVVAAARLKLPVAVTGWLCCAENMPSGAAIRPGDVLSIYGGKTVEVLNTDAEGRLVLADGLVRAAEDKPDALINIATLTGAQTVALGPRIAGLMGNDDALRDRVRAAGQRAGEEFWPMPLPADLRDRLDSSVADIANVPPTGGRDAGMLVAGLFLQDFVAAGLPWAHLDIAGPGWHAGEATGERSKGGTGFGVRTLVEVIESFARP